MELCLYAVFDQYQANEKNNYSSLIRLSRLSILYPLCRPLSPRIAGFPITPSSRFIYAISSPRPSIMDINRSRPNVCCLGPTPFDKICSLVSCLKLHAKRILPFFFHPSLLFPTTGINPYSEELYCSRL